MTRGLIGDIGRYTFHDGPGIRTTIFFMGCPLHCPWCHNPEMIMARTAIAFYQERCISCGDCVSTCPEGAIKFPSILDRIDRRLCTSCGQCAAVCPARALRQIGEWYTAESLLEIILRDRLFYETSNGGVTLSGGEPTQQLDFLVELLQLLKNHNLHTALQTCGFFPWDAFAEKALDQLDLIFFDLKIADSSAHKAILGKGNEVILENLGRLARIKSDAVVARIPLIPEYTVTEENINSFSKILREIGIHRIALLPYHPWGNSKATIIDRKPDKKLSALPMGEADKAKWHDYFTSTGIVCY